MPKAKRTEISTLPVIDLAYAVERLVAGGKTSKDEVLGLAADRGKRIAFLEAELRDLRGGAVVGAKVAKPGRPAAKRVRKVAPEAAPAPSPRPR